MRRHPRSKFWACAIGTLLAIHFIGAGAALADEVVLKVSHRLINVIEFEDGTQEAEVEFTVSNTGIVDLYDLRFSFGLHAPEPFPPEGEPIMRIESLAAADSVTVAWTLAGPDLIGDMVASSPLQGWTEAVHTESLEIIAFPVTSSAEEGAQ